MTWRQWTAARYLLAEEFRHGPEAVREAAKEAVEAQAFSQSMKNLPR
jgi:hypothetical protein